MILPLFSLFVLASEPPAAPPTLDVTQPTCIAVGGQDADALYVVPASICDSRTCILRLELQAVRADGAPIAPEVLGEGELTAGAGLWNKAVRSRVAAAAARFRFPCKTTPLTEPLQVGIRQYRLAARSGSWWATSDNGREVPLSRLGAGAIQPSVVDGHPDLRTWAFARATDSDGHLVLQKIPLPRLAAPTYDELIATPRSIGEDLTCLGWDTDAPAMLVKARRSVCTPAAAGSGETPHCIDEARLVRINARGSEELMVLSPGRADQARSYLAELDLGCTDDGLDEPTFDGRTLIVGPSLSESTIELTVFQPQEKHWNLGTLRSTPDPASYGRKRREAVDAILWHPSVPFLVLSVTSGTATRYVWVDLAARGVVKRAR